MRRVHTHYDNLKVSRNAPLEVVRAAYRALAQRHHPDVNASPDSARVMKLLNEAWEILGDPKRRAEHDTWIAEQEAKQDNGSPESPFRANAPHQYSYNTASQTWSQGPSARANAPRKGQPPSQSSPPPSREPQTARGEQSSPSALDRFNSWLANAGRGTYVVLGWAALGFAAWALSTGTTKAPSAPAPIPQPEQVAIKGPQYTPPPQGAYRLSPTPPAGEFVIPESVKRRAAGLDSISPAVPVAPGLGANRWSPNGEPWPTTAGYLKGKGIQQRAFGGLSKLTIDNTSGGSDVHVKLCRLSIDRCDGLRHIFIPQGASFTMASITAGTYDIRYRDLTSGHTAKSQPIALQQIEDDQGTRFSVVKLTLYRVSGGNTSFAPLPDEQF